MINAIAPLQHSTYYKNNNKQVTFAGTSNIIARNVIEVDSKHLPLLYKISEFFKETKRLLLERQNENYLQCGHTKIFDFSEPVPIAKIQLSKHRWILLNPKKYRTDDGKRIGLCHIEVHNPPEENRFEIVITDSVAKPQLGDLFALNFHKADNRSLSAKDAAKVNKILDMYSSEISSGIKFFDNFTKKQNNRAEHSIG